MQETILYIKLVQNAEVTQKEIFLKDIAKVTCRDPHIIAKAKALKIYTFQEDKRQIISMLKIIELLEGISPNLTIDNIGSTTEVVVERIESVKSKGILITVKTILVALVCFFGTAFTVMSFHNDIGINEMFEQIFFMVTGTKSDGCTILEIAYSVGLGSGIIIFFNHIGKRRITKDPTPVEVEMREYEMAVNTALSETADREGKTIDVS